jgi:hypothetical protein
LEGKLPGGLAVDTHAPFSKERVWLRQDICKQSEFIKQMRCARLQHFAAKFAVEALMAFENNNRHSTFGQQ